MSGRLTWRTVKDNYSTYCDQQTHLPEKHRKRLLWQTLASLVLSGFVNNLSDDSISVLVTALSILIGFAFAAMFPIALESISGLPRALYAEDRDDIKTIRTLATYFRFNVAYFIPLALACVSVLLIQMLNISLPAFLLEPVETFKKGHEYKWELIVQCAKYTESVLLAISLFLLQECCYTFYRMCFNALALLRIKEEYIASRPDE